MEVCTRIALWVFVKSPTRKTAIIKIQNLITSRNELKVAKRNKSHNQNSLIKPLERYPTNTNSTTPRPRNDLAPKIFTQPLKILVSPTLDRLSNIIESHYRLSLETSGALSPHWLTGDWLTHRCSTLNLRTDLIKGWQLLRILHNIIIRFFLEFVVYQGDLKEIVLIFF